MDPWQSQVGLLSELCVQLLARNPLGSPSCRHLRRDIETVRSRVSAEGLSFLTKSLPKLGKALDQGLSQLRFSVPRGFAHEARGVSRPAFMQVYFKRIFADDGSYRADACPEAVKHLRQVLFLAYKLELPYGEEVVRDVVSGFVDVDDSVGFSDTAEVAELVNLAATVAEDVFCDFDHKDIVPRHGPGAVATGERLEQKWEFSRLYSNIHAVYPYYDYFIVGGARELLDRRNWYFSLDRIQSGTAKVVLVPKDSRGPRLISSEPLEYQWIQQGLGRKIVAHLESVRLTRGRVNFTNQEINRRLALSSSLTGEFATLDLKEASDRVSLDLVRRVFGRVPGLLRAFEATRSTHTLLPDGRVHELKKFAPMGSALCFPVEAFVFWSIAVCAVVRSERMPLREAASVVFVYGDDVIVPTHLATVVVQALESVGLLVNTQKSCILGDFRESCGMDAFKGVQVTPTRVKKPWTMRASDGTALVSYSSTANQLAEKGYDQAASFLWDALERCYGVIPYGTRESGFPCKWVKSATVAETLNRALPVRRRHCSRYQRLEFQVKFVSPRRLDSTLDSWPRLLRTQVFPGDEEPSTVVVPRSTKIKRGWKAVV